MKKIKFNYFSLFLIIVFVLITFCFYRYYHFDHIGEGFLISPEPVILSSVVGGDKFSLISDEPINFTFVSDRYNPRAIIVEIKKKTFVPDEDDIQLIVDILYDDMYDNNIKRKESFSYPLKNLALGGDQILYFSKPLINAKGQKVSMTMRLSQKLETKDVLLIDNNHYRLLYNEEIRGVADRTYNKFIKDTIFTRYYFGILIVLVFPLLALLLFKSEESKKNKYGKKR